MPDEFDAHIDPVPDFVSDFNPSSGADFGPAPGLNDFENQGFGIDPVTGAALVAGAVTLGAGFGTSALSAQEGKKSRKFTEYMYRNRRQMEVADLKAAGLNPILAAGNMGGGSPSAGIARQDLGDPAASMSKLAGTALASRRQKQELKNMAAAEADLRERAALANQQKATSKEQERLIKNQATSVGFELPRLENQANIDVSSAGQYLAVVERLMKLIPGIGVAAMFGGPGRSKRGQKWRSAAPGTKPKKQKPKGKTHPDDRAAFDRR